MSNRQPAWNECPLQVLPRPRCPHCSTTAIPILVRSERAEDGSSWQRCICKGCSQRFLRVLTTNESLPSFGDN